MQLHKNKTDWEFFIFHYLPKLYIGFELFRVFRFLPEFFSVIKYDTQAWVDQWGMDTQVNFGIV